VTKLEQVWNDASDRERAEFLKALRVFEEPCRPTQARQPTRRPATAPARP
jgi:hypothetical protein